MISSAWHWAAAGSLLLCARGKLHLCPEVPSFCNALYSLGDAQRAGVQTLYALAPSLILDHPPSTELGVASDHCRYDSTVPSRGARQVTRGSPGSQEAEGG